MRRHAQSPRARDAIEAVVLCSAALVLSTARTLIPTAVVDVPTALVAVGALALVFGTRVSTVWVILGGAIVTLRLAIWDGGDQVSDSTVLLDGFEWITSGTVAVSTTPSP